MNVVIAGAGDVGFHLAELLANENQNTTLIDLDEKLLQYAGNQLDVLTVQGDASSLKTLRDCNIQDAHLFIAATTHESTNLLAAKLAKNLGAKKTIARINKAEYLLPDAKHLFHGMGIDHLISPNKLASQEIERLIQRNSVTDIFDFEQGKLSIVGIVIDNKSRFINQTFSQINKQNIKQNVRVICLLRNGQTIIPTMDMQIKANDHIYLATNYSDFNELNIFIGKDLQSIKRVMITGDSPLALQTAQRLEHKLHVKLIVNNERRCKEMLSVLQKTMVINADYNNVNMLKEEGLENTDAFIALTKNAETNIISCITAEQAGVNKTIALVDNSAYISISQNIGVDTIINKKLIAANNIFRHVRKGKVEAIASMHGVDAEVIEFEIHKKNHLLNHPICDLHIPKDSAIIAGIVRDNQGILPNKNFMLNIGDKIIVLALPSAIKKIESIFK